MASWSRNPITPKLFLAGMLGGLGGAVLVILAMVLLGEYTKTGGRLFLTALVLAGFCLSALAPSVLYLRQRFRPLATAGMLAAAAGFILVATGIWATPDPDAFWKTAAIASILAWYTFQVSLVLLLDPGRTLVRGVQRVAVAAASLAAVLPVLGIILELKAAPYWWAVFLIVVTALVGSFAALVLNRRTGAGATTQASAE